MTIHFGQGLSTPSDTSLIDADGNYYEPGQPLGLSLSAQSEGFTPEGGFTAATSAPWTIAQPEIFGNASPFGLSGDGFTFTSNVGGGGAHGGGGSGGGGTPAPWSTPTIPNNNLKFVINWDSSVAKAPSGFVTAFETAVSNIQQNLNSHNPDTITLNVGWGEAGGSRLPFGALGESQTNINQESYSALYNALSPHAYLPSDPITGTPTNPISGTHSYWMASAEQRALGLGPISGSPDGSVGFSSSTSWNFGTGTGTGYDFISVAEHEISEAMGRIDLLGASISDGGTIYQNGFAPMDLFRYSSSGHLSLVGGQTAYFSPDGGATGGVTNNLTNEEFTYFNTTAGGDWGDWQSSGATSAGKDAYTAFASSGTQYSISNVDQALMAALGYHG